MHIGLSPLGGMAVAGHPLLPQRVFNSILWILSIQPYGSFSGCYFLLLNHNYNCDDGFNLHGCSSSFRSSCGSFVTMDPEWHKEVLLVSPLCCHSNNLNPRCLFRLMPIMPWVLLRWVFPFRNEHPANFNMLVAVMVLLSLSGSHIAAMFTTESSTIWFGPLQPFGIYLWQEYVPPHDCPWPTPGVHWVAAPSTAWVGRASCYSLSCPPGIPSIWSSMELWRLGRESPNHSTYPTCLDGFFSSRFCSTRWHGHLWISGGH